MSGRDDYPDGTMQSDNPTYPSGEDSSTNTDTSSTSSCPAEWNKPMGCD